MNSIKKNAALNVTRQVCSVIFPLITFPYAVRILQADNYGKFTFSSSIISYLTLIAGLGISSYAVREGARLRGNNEKLSAFSDEVFTVNLFSTAIAYIILFVFIALSKKLQYYDTIIIILSLSVLFTTLGTDWLNTIFEDYAYLTKRYIICRILSIILLFLLVRDPDDIILYAFVSVFGTVLANIMNIIYIRRKWNIHPKPVFTRNIIRHITPLLLLFANTVASTIYINCDATILGFLKDDRSVGIYGVSAQIYTIIKGIINAAIIVIIPRVSYMIEKGSIEEINDIYRKTISSVFLIVVPCTVGLVFLNKDIITLVAGKSYIQSSTPLAILSAALLFATGACFFINAVSIPFRKERYVLILTLISAVMNIVLNLILIPKYNYNAAAFTTLLSEILMFTGGFLISRNLVSIYIKRDIILAAISGILVLAACVLVSLFAFNYVLRIVLSIVFSFFLYVGFLCIVKDNIVYEIIISAANQIGYRQKM